MTPVQEAVTSVLRNSRIFSGRAARPEFWWFALAAYVVYVIAGLIPRYLVDCVPGSCPAQPSRNCAAASRH